MWSLIKICKALSAPEPLVWHRRDGMASLLTEDGGEEVWRVTPSWELWWERQNSQKHHHGAVNVLTSELRLCTRWGLCGLCAGPQKPVRYKRFGTSQGQPLKASAVHVPLLSTCTSSCVKRRKGQIFKTFSIFCVCSGNGQIFHINYFLLPVFVMRAQSPNCRACELQW